MKSLDKAYMYIDTKNMIAKNKTKKPNKIAVILLVIMVAVIVVAGFSGCTAILEDLFRDRRRPAIVRIESHLGVQFPECTTVLFASFRPGWLMGINVILEFESSPLELLEDAGFEFYHVREKDLPREIILWFNWDRVDELGLGDRVNREGSFLWLQGEYVTSSDTIFPSGSWHHIMYFYEEKIMIYFQPRI